MEIRVDLFMVQCRSTVPNSQPLLRQSCQWFWNVVMHLRGGICITARCFLILQRVSVVQLEEIVNLKKNHLDAFIWNAFISLRWTNCYLFFVGFLLPFDKHLKYLMGSFRCRIIVCLQWWEESFYYFVSIYQNCLIKSLPHTNNCFQFCTFFFKRWCLLLCKRQGTAYLKHVFLWKIKFLKFICFLSLILF